MKRRRILVLGSDGFIGRRMLQALAATEWAQPVAASRRALAQPSQERVQLDATSEDELGAALRSVEGVINCVAGNGHTIRSNAQALFAAAERNGRPRIVHLSTMSVYGSATGEVSESDPLLGDLGDYSAAKLMAEQIASTYGRSVILRPGCVYGPGSPQWSGRIARWLRSERIGDLGAAGDGYCNLVHVDDVVQAALRGLSEDVEGQAFNLSLPEPPTWNEYFLQFGKALGAVPVQRIGSRRLKIETKLLAPPLKIAEILGKRVGLRDLPPPIPPSLLGLWKQEIRLNVRKADELLRMQWTPLQQGLLETAHWYRAPATA